MTNKPGLIVILILISAAFVLAQPSTSAVEKLEKLKLELIEVQGKEDNLRSRAQQLDEDMKPENIARSLAGVGSTKPEELREYRRRQLELERKNVQLQLDNLIAKRVRLESDIRTTEIQAYHDSAKPTPNDAINQSFVGRLSTAKTLLIGLAGGALAVMGGAIFFIRRRTKLS